MARRSRFAWSRWLPGALGVGFAHLAWVYLTLPDVRVLAATNPETTAFIEIRREEAHDAGKSFTLRRRWVPHGRISNHLKRAVIVAEDSAFFGTRRPRLQADPRIDRRQSRGRRARSAAPARSRSSSPRISISRSRAIPPASSPVHHHAASRDGPQQAAHLRDLPELDRMGRRIFGCEAAARAYFGKSAADPRSGGSGDDGRRHHQPARAQPGETDAAAAAKAADHPRPYGPHGAAGRGARTRACRRTSRTGARRPTASAALVGDQRTRRAPTKRPRQ